MHTANHKCPNHHDCVIYDSEECRQDDLCTWPAPQNQWVTRIMHNMPAIWIDLYLIFKGQSQTIISSISGIIADYMIPTINLDITYQSSVANQVNKPPWKAIQVQQPHTISRHCQLDSTAETSGTKKYNDSISKIYWALSNRVGLATSVRFENRCNVGLLCWVPSFHHRYDGIAVLLSTLFRIYRLANKETTCFTLNAGKTLHESMSLPTLVEVHGIFQYIRVGSLQLAMEVL